MNTKLALALVAALLTVPVMAGSDVFDRVEHGYADSGGVKIHYVSLGQGPLVVMSHGFPDFWYTWRDQMEARAFQEKGPDAPDVFFGGPMTPQTLSGWVSDPKARERYVEAFERSDFTADPRRRVGLV